MNDFRLYQTCPFGNDTHYADIWKLIYFLVNFFIFLLLNIRIEVIIVRRLHKELADKRTRAGHMTNSINSNGNLSMRAKRKLEMDGKKEQKAITMVVSNSLINFILRFSEIFLFLINDTVLFPDNTVY
jgi:hypothetical protein